MTGGAAPNRSSVRARPDRPRPPPSRRSPSQRSVISRCRSASAALGARGPARARGDGRGQSRHGSGTYIPDGPPSLGSEPLSFLAALHGFTREEMYEARRILEVEAAGLAADARRPKTWRRSPRRSPGSSPTATIRTCSSFTTSTSIATSPRRRRTRSSARSSAWCRASTTSGGEKRQRAPPIAICATRPKLTGGSTSRSARAIAEGGPPRDERSSSAGQRYQAQEPEKSVAPDKAERSARPAAPARTPVKRSRAVRSITS